MNVETTNSIKNLPLGSVTIKEDTITLSPDSYTKRTKVFNNKGK